VKLHRRAYAVTVSMETDTLPYDGDVAAWDGWQVPAYQSGCKNQDNCQPEADVDIAPTIPYDTAVCDMAPDAVGDATLAYDADAPGGIPHVSNFSAMPPPPAPPAPAQSRGAACRQEAPTLAYGDTLVLEHAEDVDKPAEEERPSSLPSGSSTKRSELPNELPPPLRAPVTRSGLRWRLSSKQPPPAGYVPPVPTTRARASLPAKRPQQRAAVCMGCKVTVQGDGWGGGTGEYEATVVDSDELSLTVVYRDEDKKWKETHVLLQHCKFLDAGPEAGASRRRTI